MEIANSSFRLKERENLINNDNKEISSNKQLLL